MKISRGFHRMFSRRTIVETFNFVRFTTHKEIQMFALTYELEDVASGSSLQDRTYNIVQYLIKPTTDPKQVTEIIKDLVNKELQNMKIADEYDQSHVSFDEKHPKLHLALRQDGFSVVDYKLLRQMPESINATGNQDELFTLLDKHNFSVCRGHLEQALNAHSLGDWAAANAQLRAYTEGLFDGFADEIFGAAVAGYSSNAKRESLGRTSPPLLDPAFNELGQDGKNFSNGLMKRLHPQGAHAGLSNEEDCTFRLHLVVLTSSYYLRKFDMGISS